MDLGTSVGIRAANTADAASLALVGQATFLETYAHLLPVVDILAHAAHQHAAQVYSRWLSADPPRIWLAEHLPGRAPVGYAVLTAPELPLDGIRATDIELRRIYLLHRFQQQGIGRQLFEQAVAGARSSDMRRLLLGVYSRNEAALEFYRRQGFSQVGTRLFTVGANQYFDYILAINL